ncbi:chromosomal replication initiator protein DnaA [Eubacterium sp. AM46-8]|nr:chromosomal replication initiator protein DnaA [Eubacterium sp. AM49-13BH]RGZ88493.1 chromosomal replication initiator protein DnaA [Eubacterium sp. AM46-8]HAJ49708.1 chromosomal replication initiator protein DnaA [Eubacterium sp.]
MIDKWDLILSTFKEEHEIIDVSFKTWIKPLKIYKLDGDVLTLTFSSLDDDSSADERSIIYVEKRYLKHLTCTICEVMNKEYSVIIMSSAEKKEDELKKKTSSVSTTNNIATQNLNPNYTFDTFVIGTNNNLAHAASLAVAETPGQIYNPLFIYGGAGLGKTHLMQAIAHFIIASDPSKKVLYVTSETFTNELIESVKTNKNTEFRNKYRNIDVLLIDDIQFIIGKVSTQEEFFNTFNDLYMLGKQIVISSDRPPKEMETLPDRLRTRFESGLPVDIQIPTYETKMAIINKKSEALGIDFPYEVKDYVATNITSSIRELEGALTKLSAYSKLSHTPLTAEFAENTLKDLISPYSKKEITPELIIDVVAEHFHIKPEDIISHKRSADIAFPRHIAMYLCRQMTQTPLEAIGKALGGRDHSTILYGSEKIAKETATNETTKSTIDILIKKLNPS